MRLFLPRLVFRAEVTGPDTFRFIAEIFLRVGPMGARLNKREFDAVREPMRIEGIHFKRHAEHRACTHHVAHKEFIMRISAMILAMSAALPFPPPASGQSKAPTEAQCREMINGMVNAMKSAPLQKEKDKQGAKELIDQIEKLVRDNRAQGVSECATWASVAKMITTQ